MCQIIALKTTRKKLKKIYKNKHIKDTLQSILDSKGGDYYSGAMISGEVSMIVKAGGDIETVFEEFLEFLKIKEIKNSSPLQLLVFSRQRPEMEEALVKEQPYVMIDFEKRYVFSVHGTIHNDKEISEDMNLEIQVDTELLQKMDIPDWDKLEGCFSVLGIDMSVGRIFKYEAGLKIWETSIIVEDEWLADIYSTTELINEAFRPKVINLSHPIAQNTDRTLFASFSGGMDISLSTFKELANNKYTKLVLNYFAWGSKAEEMETLQLIKFKKFYAKEFPSIEVEICIWEAEKYFNEYFEMNGAPLPKISISNLDSTADNLETESPLAYVPYRNTQFAILLASKAESMKLHNVDLLFGLNLSEGMVFMDNSEGWLESINEVVKYGGKDFKVSGSYQVIAPYFPRTKTNMIKEFNEEFGLDTLKKLLNLSKSCYYPDKNDSPCGQCGSCILRKKALQNLEGME